MPPPGRVSREFLSQDGEVKYLDVFFMSRMEWEMDQVSNEDVASVSHGEERADSSLILMYSDIQFCCIIFI